MNVPERCPRCGEWLQVMPPFIGPRAWSLCLQCGYVRREPKEKRDD